MRDDEEECATGGESLGEANEEPVLEPPELRIRVVRGIQEEDRGPRIGTQAERQASP